MCTPLPSSIDALSPGVQDPKACLTAISGTCPQFLSAMDLPPPACRPLPGKKTNEFDGCLIDAQCGADMFCIKNNFVPQHGAGCTKFCTKYSNKAEGQICLGSNDICNPPKHSLCLWTFDATKMDKVGTSDPNEL